MQLTFGAGDRWVAQPTTRDNALLWIIVLLLIIFAIGDGVAVSNLLRLLLVVAFVVAILALVSGRRAVQRKTP